MIGVITINTDIMADNSEHFNNITFFLYYTSFGRRITPSNIYSETKVWKCLENSYYIQIRIEIGQ